MPQKKQTLAELANDQLAKQSGGQNAADALDEGKRQARILHQMRENKNTMSQSRACLIRLLAFRKFDAGFVAWFLI